MKPSEVIARLAEILREEGESPLFFTDEDGNYYKPKEIIYDEDDAEIIVRMAMTQ